MDLARKRLQIDIQDDWYHDPLKYVDLLNKDYLFKQFETYFGTNTYNASEAEIFYVPKKKLTVRQALISPFIDRLMYMAVVGVIAEKLDNALLPNVFSARYNRFSKKQLTLNGVEQWKKMKYKLAEYANLKHENGNYVYGCIIEIDILNFFDNINKRLLVEKIKRVCETSNERNATQLLFEILQKLSKKEVGLPQNSDASSLLASFYLNQVDLFIQHQAPGYFRFMDDIKIFCEDKYEARKILQLLESELRRCNLSVNSQKTEIFSLTEDAKEGNRSRNSYNNIFDFEINKIGRLSKAKSYAYLNEAFHLSISLFKENLDNEDINSSDESARRLNYALNTIAFLGRKKISLFDKKPEFKEMMEKAIRELKDKPWVTAPICRILNLISLESINKNQLHFLKEIVINDKYNTYSYQTYQIWLLLAKLKFSSPELKKYAIQNIEKNDATNRPAIAGMIIYLSSINYDYRRVVLRKFEERFVFGYFQNRTALVSLRSFKTEIINNENIDNSLKHAHEFMYKNREKDLVFVQGFDEDDEEIENDNIEQLYSL